MLPDILLRGGKKFGYLRLVKPHAAIFGIQGNGAFTIGGVVYD